MNSISITTIVLICIFVIVLISYFMSLKFLSKDIIILITSILFIVSASLNLMQYYSEGFYFEVSPQRKKCLEEQVSLKNYGKRSCSCCQKGTVGGYPPLYKDWFEPTIDGKSLWHRTDNWTLDKNEQTMIPPTEYVDLSKKVKKTQKEMYNQIM